MDLQKSQYLRLFFNPVVSAVKHTTKDKNKDDTVSLKAVVAIHGVVHGLQPCESQMGFYYVEVQTQE